MYLSPLTPARQVHSVFRFSCKTKPTAQKPVYGGRSTSLRVASSLKVTVSRESHLNIDDDALILSVSTAGKGNGDKLKEHLLRLAGDALRGALAGVPVVNIVSPYLIDSATSLIKDALTNWDGPVFYNAMVVQEPLKMQPGAAQRSTLTCPPMTRDSEYSLNCTVTRLRARS
jgi:hypothetical protein